MRRRLSVWLLLSLGIHGGLLCAVLLVITEIRPPMLFVDLVQARFASADPAPTGSSRGGDGAPPAAGQAPRDPIAPPKAVPPSERSASPSGASPSEAPHKASARAPEPAPSREMTEPLPGAIRRHAGPFESPAPAPLRVPTEPIMPMPADPLPPARAAVGPPSAPGGGGVTGQGAPVPTQTGGGADASSSTRGLGGGLASGIPGASDGMGLGTREGSMLALAVPGDGSGAAAEYDGYVRLLRRRVQDSLRYPPAARRREVTGTVKVEVEVQPTGAIEQVALVESSSHRLLDEAALEAARGIERVPFPPGVAPRRLRVRIPIDFQLE